jgi:hypothetical protein
LEGNSEFIKNPGYIAHDTLRWTYQYQNTPVKRFAARVITDDIRQIRNGVYYIPKSAYGKYFIADMLGRNIPIQKVSKSADYSIVDLSKYAAKGKFVILHKKQD